MAGQERRLKVEPLEDRRMLAVYTVDFAGPASQSGELMSFTEALAAANSTPEADTIDFSPTLAGSEINLSTYMPPNIDYSEIRVVYDLTIQGLGSDLLTFLPGQGSNHSGFSLLYGVENFTISGVTFGKRTVGNTSYVFNRLVGSSSANVRFEDVVASELAGQPAIKLDWQGTLTLVDTKLAPNATATQNFFAIDAPSYTGLIHLERTELLAYGGGVRSSGNIVAIDTTVTARPNLNYGGLVSGGTVDVTRSVVNGFSSGGGGIRAQLGVTVVDSTISNNTAEYGGGIYTADGPLTIVGSTVENNVATRRLNGGGGGAYKGGLNGAVAIVNSSFINNRAIESVANGGGLYSTKPVTVIDSRFLGNRTATARPDRLIGGSAGGAIYSAGQIATIHDTPKTSSIVNSLFEGNSVSGQDSDGGAIWIAHETHIEGSTFRGNYTTGADGDGGAVHMGNGSVSNSTFVGNYTLGEDADGGALTLLGSANLVFTNTTISDNSTAGARSDGGGVHNYALANILFQFSTIAGNRVQHTSSVGGGIAFRDPQISWANTSGGVTLHNSIVANNSSAGTHPDLYLRIDNLVSNYSLIESTAGLTPSQLALIAAGTGNIVGQDPLLGPLVNNGGTTLTHNLLEGSPARDVGDPDFAAPPFSDQRTFARLSNGRSDMGAVEVQVPSRAGDWDGDGDIDGRDFLQWQRGGSPELFSSGDLTGWQEAYGGEDNLEFGLQNAEWDDVTFGTLSLAPALATAGQASSGTLVPVDSYAEEVDRVVEEWQAPNSLLSKPTVASFATSSGVHEFGELVTRRSVKRLRWN